MKPTSDKKLRTHQPARRIGPVPWEERWPRFHLSSSTDIGVIVAFGPSYRVKLLLLEYPALDYDSSWQNCVGADYFNNPRLTQPEAEQLLGRPIHLNKLAQFLS